MLKRFLNNQNSDYIQGLENLRLREFDSAVNLFEKSLEQNPHFSFAYHYLGESYFALSKFEDAERAFLQAAERNPHFAPTHLFLGATAGKKGDYLKKEEFYQTALRDEEKSGKELKQLAQTLIKIGDAEHPAVFDLYLKAHQSNPQDFEIYLEIAEIYPPVLAVHTKFGEYLAQTGKTEQSIFFLYLAAHSESKDKENWLKLADVLDKSGDFESAEICRKRVEDIR